MIKLGTIGMIADNKKSFPQVKAHADIANGYFCTITDTDTVAPTSTTILGADLCVVLNTKLGDNCYKDFTINKDENCNAFLLKQWEKQYLTVDEGHITYGTGEDYSDITEGTTNLTIDANGKLAITADVSTYLLYFAVVSKVQFNGKNAVKVRIVTVDKDTVSAT
jgi:nucleoside-specific outer membrane channel protein Tsx